MPASYWKRTGRTRLHGEPGCPSKLSHGTAYARHVHRCACADAVADLKAERRRRKTRTATVKSAGGAIRGLNSRGVGGVDQVAVDFALRGYRLALTALDIHVATEKLVARGETKLAIARTLRISGRTVQRHANGHCNCAAKLAEVQS